MKKTPARNKGLVTGLIMIALSLFIYKLNNSFEYGLQYLVYAVYVAGILWTLITFKRETGNTGGFRQYFSEAFRCFIVVTLLMVLFTLVFILLHPELKEQMAEMMQKDMATAKDLTPSDIRDRIDSAKKFYLPGYIMAAVMSYLAMGVLISVAGSAFLVQRKLQAMIFHNCNERQK